MKLPRPNVHGQFQLENISTAIATLRIIKQLNTNDMCMKSGITKIPSIARLQEITEGKLKNLVKDNRLLLDGSHNPLGAKVLNNYLDTDKAAIPIWGLIGIFITIKTYLSPVSKNTTY